MREGSPIDQGDPTCSRTRPPTDRPPPRAVTPLEETAHPLRFRESVRSFLISTKVLANLISVRSALKYNPIPNRHRPRDSPRGDSRRRCTNQELTACTQSIIAMKDDRVKSVGREFVGGDDSEGWLRRTLPLASGADTDQYECGLCVGEVKREASESPVGVLLSADRQTRRRARAARRPARRSRGREWRRGPPDARRRHSRAGRR